jgi:hypothetical protein
MRDPRVDPRPGDELRGPVVKTKVLSITLSESGTAEVEYTLAGLHFDYHEDYSSTVSLERWKQFAAPGLVVVAVGEGA